MSILCSFGSAPFAAASDPLPVESHTPSPGAYLPASADPAGRVIEKQFAEKQAAANAAAPADWQAGVENDIRRAEYEISWQRSPAPGIPDAYQAPNRAQGFRTRFTENGVVVVPLSEGTEATQWTWGLRLVRFGSAGNTAPVVPASPSVRASSNRAEYDHGVLSEWFVNDERGLEQGFTIPAPIARRDGGAATEIHLDLTLSGNLLAYPAEDGQSIDFRTAQGVRELHYGALKVNDARDTKLPARMQVIASGDGNPVRIRISVDVRGAVYPLTIDPLATSPAWTAESDQISAEFGVSVASAGDVNGDGYSDVIIGAHYFDNGQTDEGRAFLYLGSASGLATSPAWTSESDQVSANFGSSVASAGDVNGDGYSDVIVGAIYFDNSQTDEGRAFLYLGSAAGLAVTPAWTAESDQVSAYFSQSVASAGDVNGDGYSDVIVGAHAFDNGQAQEGRAFLYLGSAAGLALTPAWTAEGDQFGYFGVSVASAGDVNGDGYADVIVGAHTFDNGQSYEGRAFLYLGSAAGLATNAAWTAESNQVGASFGVSVASAGDVNGDGYSDVIVGAYGFDNGQTDEGRAFLYLGSASGLAATAAWTAEGDQDSAFFGFPLASAGDVNGDGYSDVIVGAYRFENVEPDEGRALLYLGSAAGLAATAAWTAESDQTSALFGVSVASAGDVNGDGYADVIVGARSFDNGETDEGRAFLYLGSASGLAATPAWTAESDQAGANFGYSVASAGDVNGDGYSDVIVGALYFDNGQADEGRAFLYLGSASGLAATPAWSAESDQASARFGYSVASAGDVNGDGYSDVIVGAMSFDNGEPDEGRAFLYLGSASGLAATPAWTAESDQASAYFGVSVASAGDVNGDGYSDVIVGAFYFDNGQTDEGRAFLYLGSASGLAATPAWTAESDQASAYFGVSVASAGDVNGDGYSDVIVGAFYFDNGQTDEGRAFLYLGSASGVAATPAWTAESDQASAYFGVSVASAGDVNGDGYSDVIVGAYYFDNGQTNEGRVFLYAGNDGFGVPLLPRQFQSDGITPIAPLCRTNTDSFRVAARGKSPFGRGKVRLEWEVKPLAVRLNGTDTAKNVTWSDSGTTGAPLAGSTLFSSGGPYHWRARLRYHPTTAGFQPTSRWLSIQPGGWQQTHLRAFACTPPDERIYLYSVTRDGGNNPILHFQDPNQPYQTTGYNIYRAANPAGPWTLMGSNVVDMDAGTPNIQWTDVLGSVGSWYYQVAAYNANCPAEGPW